MPFRTRVVYAFLFALAFWFYSGIWPSAPVLVSDSPTYLSAAQDLRNFQVSQDRTPGYPLLLVLTGSSQNPNRTLFRVSLLLHFASVLILGLALSHAGVAEIPVNLFAALLLLPPFVEPAAYVLSENLTEIALVAGFVSFQFWIIRSKTIWIFASAVTFAFAALTRPTYQFVIFALVGFIMIARLWSHWFSRRRLEVVIGSVILSCGFLFLVGGFCYLNYRSFGYFGVTPKLGLTLSTKTWRFIERLPDEYGSIKAVLINSRNVQLIKEGGDHEGSMSIWAAVPELTNVTGLEYKRLSDYMFKVNLLLIQKAPLTYLREVIWSFGSYWFPSSTHLANFNSRAVQFLWAVLHFLFMAAFAFNAILLIGAGTYIWKSKQIAKVNTNALRDKLKKIDLQAVLYSLAGMIVMYTAVISCFIEVGDPRYRVPTDALMMFMLFVGADLWRRLIDFSRNIDNQFHRSCA